MVSSPACFLSNFDETGIGVTVTDRGVRAHHVEILLAVFVPDINAFAARQHDGQGMVVVRAIPVFEFDGR